MKSFNFFRPLAAMLTVVLAITLVVGCSKDELLTRYGTVLYTGTLSSGGCEWIISIDTVLYQPRNLPVQFQTDGLTVQVTYRVVQSTANCPNAQDYSGLIHLNKIK